MTRGNQRDKARQKNLKKQADQKKTSGSDQKGANKGLSLEERRRRDADIMRNKQDKKAADAAGASGSDQ